MKNGLQRFEEMLTRRIKFYFENNKREMTFENLRVYLGINHRIPKEDLYFIINQLLKDGYIISINRENFKVNETKI